MLVIRLLVALALLMIGACAAIAATLVHESWWGLALGLAAAALTTRALLAGTRRCAFMLGWFGAVSYAVLPRAEGDYLIAATGLGYTFLAGSFAIFLAALVTLPGPGSRPRGDGDDPRQRGPGT